jgi:hypothetical protein
MGWLILILFLSPFIIMLFVYVILPLTLLTIGGLTIAGAASAIFMAFKNLGAALVEAHRTVK